MRRFILTTAIALSILASGTANIGYAENNGFGDVTGAVLYCEDIQRLNDMGVLSGYGDGNFYPDNNAVHLRKEQICNVNVMNLFFSFVAENDILKS